MLPKNGWETTLEIDKQCSIVYKIEINPFIIIPKL